MLIQKQRSHFPTRQWDPGPLEGGGGPLEGGGGPLEGGGGQLEGGGGPPGGARRTCRVTRDLQLWHELIHHN